MSVLSDWLSTQEAAKMAGYHPHNILRLIKNNEIEARKWGNSWMIQRESLRQYLLKIEAQGKKRGPKTDIRSKN